MRGSVTLARLLLVIAATVLGACTAPAEPELALPDELPVVFEFTATADPATGTLEFGTVSLDWDAIPPDDVGFVRQWVTEQTVEADGMAGTGSTNTVEMVTLAAARGSATSLDNCAPLPVGIVDCFYADVVVRSFLTSYLGNTYVEITTMSPATGYEAYDDLASAQFGLPARRGLWRYGTIEPEPGDSSDASDNSPYQATERRWKFQLPASPRPFAIEGRVMGTVYTGSSEAPHLSSVSQAGALFTGDNRGPSVADAGRYVLFREGTQLKRVDRYDGEVVNIGEGYEARISDDGNVAVYVDDYQNGGSLIRADLSDPSAITTTVIATSVASGGSACSIRDPDITTNGDYVVFVSDCESLCAGTVGCVVSGRRPRHVYRWRASAAGDCASADIVGVDARVRISPPLTVYANNDSFQPSIADDGRTVVYTTTATNQLRYADNNGIRDVYFRDACGTLPVLVSRGNANGGQQSSQPDISADGTTIVFESGDDFGLSEDSNASTDVFSVLVSDCGATCPASAVSVVSIDGSATSAGSSVTPSISGDGCVLAFSSTAQLAAGDTGSNSDVYVVDNCGTIDPGLVSVTGFDNESDGESTAVVVSTDGEYVVFSSTAANLAEDLGRNFPGTSTSHIYTARTGL